MASAVRSAAMLYAFGQRPPALAIAAFVKERGAAYSSEILDRFLMSEATLRRRRPELRRLGLVFVEKGRGSLYVTAELARELPVAYLPIAEQNGP